MKRYLYAMRLWLWFATRNNARYEPFSWFLQHYDRRREQMRNS